MVSCILEKLFFPLAKIFSPEMSIIYRLTHDSSTSIHNMIFSCGKTNGIIPNTFLFKLDF